MVTNFPKGLGRFYKDIYELVDDPSLDSIISWRKSNDGFIISNVEELINKKVYSRFCCLNFSHFLRHLHTYGFIRVEKCGEWEFKNANFVRGRPELLDEMEMIAMTRNLKKRLKEMKAKKKVQDGLKNLRL